jgi:membrane-associated protease RseP (regulator of RpoE activity)
LRTLLEVVGLVAWVLVVVSPCHTFVHELCHGLTARAYGAHGVTVRVGADPPLLSFSTGEISFRLRLWPPWVGTTTWQQDLGRRAGIVVAAAGPLMSLALAIGLGAAAVVSHGWARELAMTAAIYAFWGFVFTAVPWGYPSWWRRFRGSPSDGYLIYDTLRRRRRTE